MEFDPGSTLFSETSSDDKEKKEKRKKAGASFKAPIAVESAEQIPKDQPEKPPVSMFDKALADMAIKRQNEKLVAEADTQKPSGEKPRIDTSTKAEKQAAAAADEALEAEHAELLANDGANGSDSVPAEIREQTVSQAEATAGSKPEDKTDDAEEQAEYKEPGRDFKNTELRPNDLPMGEGVLHLRGDTPLAEREIIVARTPGRKEAEQTPEAETLPYAEAGDVPVWRVQEQQQQAQQFETSGPPDVYPQPEAPDVLSGNGGDIPPTEPPETGQRSFEEPEEPNHSATPESHSAPTPPSVESSPWVTPNVVPPNPAANPNANPNAANTYVAAANVLNNSPGQYNQYGHYNTAPAQNNNQNNEPSIGKAELADQLHYARKAAGRRGLLTGLLVGGAYEHFKHRRREKKELKRANAQTKKWEKQQASQNFTLQEQARQLEAAKRASTASTANRTELPVPVAVQAASNERVATPNQAAAPAEQAAYQARPEAAVAVAAAAERRFPNAANVANRQLTQASEKNVDSARVANERYAHKPERSFAVKLEKLLPKRFEKNRKNKDLEVPDQLEIPPEHHIETSSWHTIEVDSKTGKPVENPSFQYGAEYYRERAHEASPRDDHRNAAAGEVALVAAAMATSSSASSTPANQPSSTDGQPPLASHRDAKKPADIAKTSLQDALKSTGPIWPWVVAFVVVVILIIVVL